ncbi:MAG TPA: L-rhamnose isomerase [Clostridiales bacterium]|nr:L-rhamnose isomerase [Clostridiales bacterium]
MKMGNSGFNKNNCADRIEKAYEYASSVYRSLGVDTEDILKTMQSMQISLHCWQGDDVTGFETSAEGLSGGGIMATGNYCGKACNGDELRQDMEKAMGLIPGKHRVNLHAIYAETGGKFVDRDELEVIHFSKWIDWAKTRGIGIDFNPTFFSHKNAKSGFTLSSKDKDIRSYWIKHGKVSRKIAAEIGKELGKTCINNVWIPDGSKDLTVSRLEHRLILRDSLDEIFQQNYDKKHLLDAVESKLFGIGSESYVVGSHEFYMGYALNRNIMLCLDAGHFHPTEGIADKISSILAFSDELLLHISRGVRWDSDHVALLTDDVLAIAQEVKRSNAFDSVHFALDFFDASINRIIAWVVGARSVLKAIMISLLEPTDLLMKEEINGNLGNRLALMEELKTLPFAAVWDKYCFENNIPVGPAWLNDIEEYEEKVLLRRE